MLRQPNVETLGYCRMSLRDKVVRQDKPRSDIHCSGGNLTLSNAELSHAGTNGLGKHQHDLPALAHTIG